MPSLSFFRPYLIVKNDLNSIPVENLSYSLIAVLDQHFKIIRKQENSNTPGYL